MQEEVPVGIPIAAICEANVAWINIRWVKLTYVQWKMTNDLSHWCYFWTFFLVRNLSEANGWKQLMPRPSRFPTKKEESETICLARRGRRARGTCGKGTQHGAALSHSQQPGGTSPAMCPHHRAARRCDRCCWSRPTAMLGALSAGMAMGAPPWDWQDVKRGNFFFLLDAINSWWRRRVLARGPPRSLLAISFLAAAPGSGLWICQGWPSISRPSPVGRSRAERGRGRRVLPLSRPLTGNL